MDFTITKASDKNFKEKVKYTSLAELTVLMENVQQDIIIYRPRGDENYEIKIYDTFVEK